MDSNATEGNNGEFDYLTIDKLEYVSVHKKLIMTSNRLQYGITVYSNDSIKPQDFQYEILIELGIVLEQFKVIGRLYVVAKSDEVTDLRMSEVIPTEKSNAFNTFNELYQQLIKALNKSLISEAEICSKFIEKIK